VAGLSEFPNLLVQFLTSRAHQGNPTRLRRQFSVILNLLLVSLALRRETAHLGAKKLLDESCVAVFLPVQNCPIPSGVKALKRNLRGLILARIRAPLTSFTPYIASICKIIPSTKPPKQCGKQKHLSLRVVRPRRTKFANPLWLKLCQFCTLRLGPISVAEHWALGAEDARQSLHIL
jgi:hypothetical protein